MESKPTKKPVNMLVAEALFDPSMEAKDFITVNSARMEARMQITEKTSKRIIFQSAYNINQA